MAGAGVAVSAGGGGATGITLVGMDAGVRVVGSWWRTWAQPTRQTAAKTAAEAFIGNEGRFSWRSAAPHVRTKARARAPNERKQAGGFPQGERRATRRQPDGEGAEGRRIVGEYRTFSMVEFTASKWADAEGFRLPEFR